MKFNRRKIKSTVFLIFIIIISTTINPTFFTNHNENIEDVNQDISRDNIEEGIKERPTLYTSSNSPPNANYFNFYKKITINSDKVSGNNDLVDFPLLVSIYDSDLHDKAQGDGDDIAFSNGTVWLDHEIELYDPNYSPTEAQLIAWVRIPLLSYSADTTIFMFYGNSTMGSRENSTSVWDSNYKGVWHLKEDPGPGGPGNIKDSTINSNHGTAVLMGSDDLEPGQIDGSFDFDGNVDPDYVNIGDIESEIKTIEYWMKPNALSSSIDSETAYHSPTATGDDYNDWTNPTYANTSDNLRVYRHYFGYDPGQDYYNFSFNIPAEANIEGIEVSIEGRATIHQYMAECTIELSWDGGDHYTTTNKELFWWSTFDSYISAGGPTDEWGKSGGWVPSQFSNTNFRVWLRESGFNPLEVDHVRVKVYYSIPSDMPMISLNSSAQIVIDNATGEIKTIGFPGTPDIYVNGTIGLNVNIGNWYHVVINDTSGVYASDFNIGRVSSTYFDGTVDEVRLSNVVRSADWIATEYNNQYDPVSFCNVSAEKDSFTDVQVNAIDLYSNIIPNVNISMIENNKIIRSDIADANGAVIFEDVFSIENKYNFSVSMTSNIVPYHIIETNRTFEAILIERSFQTINLTCNVSRNIFNIVDIDGIPVDSGMIIVGNSSDPIQNCTIDGDGHATFRWLNTTPYEYNYTVWYHDLNYNPNEIVVGSGNITTPNSEVDVTTILTTVNFTVLTKNPPITPIDGVKLILDNIDSSENIVNLTTDLNGKAALRWVNSSGINNSNYSIRVSFYGSFWDFEIPDLMTGRVGIANFTVKNKAAYDISIYFEPAELEKLETKIISLNPKSDLSDIKWDSILKLRALFNVTKVPAGFENLIGPTYADSMSYQIYKGTTLIQLKIMPKEEDYIGRHQVEIKTDELESETPYIITIKAHKSGYVLPPEEVFMSLYLLKNELILNQSENDDSLQSVYWQEITNISVKPYGKNSEDFTIEYNIYDNLDHTIKFSIPDISNDWNLSQITFNIYNISWNVPKSNINITIVDPYGSFNMFHYGNHSGHNHGLGTWTGIMLNLDKSSPTNNNSFEFIIGGSFDGTIDIIADATFIRDKINVQYSRFNITESIPLLTAVEGWAIKNITFEIYNCYNISTWQEIDLTTKTNLNITTNEGIKYSLDYGFSDGTGVLTIDDRVIYPLSDQSLFTVESEANVTFDAIISVEYIQEFFQNQYLEIINLSKTEYNFNKGGTFQVSFVEKQWIEDYATLEISGISNGPDYLLPSELEMTITVGGPIYYISDVQPGQGIFSLGVFDKNTIYTAVIETNQPVIFDLSFKIKYSRIVAYEIKGTVSYKILEAPEIYGTVQYDENLECYIQTINTSLLYAKNIPFTVEFTFNKDHYESQIKEFDLVVLDRLTLMSGSSINLVSYPNIYIKDAVNFTFSYTDAVSPGTELTNLDIQSYTLTKIGAGKQSVVVDSGNLYTKGDNEYILDFNSETLAIGRYTVWITLDKQNYEIKQAIIFLTVNKRLIDYDLGDMFEEKQVNVVKGEKITLEMELTDPTRGDIPLTGAKVVLEIDNEKFEFDEVEDGLYELEFSTEDYEAFFTSNTITGTIKISKEDYESEEVDITIVIEMEETEIIPGAVKTPTFYLLILIIAIAAIAGSLATYRYIQLAKIPKFVKKIRSMKGAIKKSTSISESLSFTNKEIYVVNMIIDNWNTLGLSIEELLGIEGIKGKTLPIIKRKIAESDLSRDLIPRGLILMKWDERIGTEIVVKYPEDIEISQKTLMQIYGAHEYTGESGMVNLMVGSLNLASYYTGQEKGYYLVLILHIEDDADAYEGGMVDVLHVLLQNLSDDSYIQIMPSLFRRLALYPTLNNEQHLINTYQDEIKRMILNRLRDEGVIAKSELMVWFKDKYKEGFIDLDAVLVELIKRELLKQVSVKGMPSELNFLTGDFITLRVPPVKLVKNPEESGLPSQLSQIYQTEVKKFFEQYSPTEFDNIKIINTLANPEVYQTFQLLRTAIVTKNDLDKLKKKGVGNISNVLKLLWDSNMIKVLQDKSSTEYYALQSDFYIELIFPKYLLKGIKDAYEQKSQSDKVLIEYLNILEDTYLNLKSREKSKD